MGNENESKIAMTEMMSLSEWYSNRNFDYS
jgi:hypothetical protein